MIVSDYAKDLIIQDIKEIMDIMSTVNKEDLSIFALAAMPYICLIVNESYEWCEKAKIQLSPFISKDALEKSRAKGKLFANDKYLNFDQQYINIEKLINIEHAYFKNLAKPYAPDFLIDEIGTYWINTVCVGNTIQYAFDFSFFSKGNNSIHNSKKELYEFAVELGKFCQEIFTMLTGDSYRMKTNYNDCVKQHSCLDFAYKRSFKNVYNVIVYSLICRINFLLFYFKNQCSKTSMLYLRVIYLTFYSFKNDLNALKLEFNNMFDSYYNSKFRNSMAHYSLYGKINNNEILPCSIGYGLIEKFFHCDYNCFVNIIEQKLLSIKDLLENSFLLDIRKGYNPD